MMEAHRTNPAVFASTPALGTASLLSFFSATCCSRLSFTPFSSRLQIRQYMILHIIHISNQFPVNACKVKITGQKKISDILFHNFTYHIYYGLCYKHESSQVQYRNALSVKILAKISPSGSDAMIRSAAANQDAETDKDMIPRL